MPTYDKKSQGALGEAIKSAGSGVQIPAMTLVREDPQMAAIISKLTVGQTPANYNNKGELAAQLPDQAKMRSVAEKTAQSTIDARTAMQLLPDLELGIQILTSSILSPKDLMTVEVTYSVPEGSMPPEISAACISVIKRHFEQTYKIVPLLNRILRDALAETGSYPVAVLPENTVDAMINGSRRPSMEELTGDYVNRDGSLVGLGLLGPALVDSPRQQRRVPSIGMEDFNPFVRKPAPESHVTFVTSDPKKPLTDSVISITDNYNALKISKLRERLRDTRVHELTKSVALESFAPTQSTQDVLKSYTDRDLNRKLYRSRQTGYEPVVIVKPQDQLHRHTVGQPLVMHLPSESVIPAFVPGQVEQHIAYFVILDGNGNPLSKATDKDYYSQLQRRLNSQGGFSSALLQKVKDQIEGFNMGQREDLDLAARIFGEMMEKEIYARMRNGQFDDNIQISFVDSVYRTMLARQLSNQATQLLFIPATMMTYFAFRYDSNGIGVSLLEDMKILLGLRAMAMFTNMQASIKNSIGRTRVRVKIDEHDPDPQKTIERIEHEIARNRQQMFPVGSNNPVEVLDYLGKAGFEILIEEHPALPNTRVEFEEANTNYVKPDTELEEDLRKRSIMKLGLTPDQLDAAYQPELATTVLRNNVLLGKRVMQIQELLLPQVDNHLRQYVLNSQNILQELEDVIRTNSDKLIRREMAAAKEAKRRDDSLPDLTEEEAKSQLPTLIYQTLRDFCTTFEVRLPQPDTMSIEAQMDGLEKHETMLNKALDYYFSESMLNSDTIGDMSSRVAGMKEVAKSYFMRKYMAENGIMTELSDLITNDEDGNPKIDINIESTEFIKSLMKSMDSQAEMLKISRLAYNEREQNRDNVDNTEVSSSPSTPPTDDITGGTEGDLGLGSPLDLDLNLDADAPTVSETMDKVEKESSKETAEDETQSDQDSEPKP